MTNDKPRTAEREGQVPFVSPDVRFPVHAGIYCAVMTLAWFVIQTRAGQEGQR